MSAIIPGSSTDFIEMNFKSPEHFPRIANKTVIDSGHSHTDALKVYYLSSQHISLCFKLMRKSIFYY